MLSKILFSLSLALSPVISLVPNQAVKPDFDTYQTTDKYLQDFNYLTEKTYRISFANEYAEIDYDGDNYYFYVIPNYYDSVFGSNVSFYYENDTYIFYKNVLYGNEYPTTITVTNYIGSENQLPFLALDYIGMSQVIEHDKEIESNTISIYNSFYNFFTGFFPNEVVNEYHGIFTFVIVSFLLFLVFGFVFYLFRVIRRLVGFK